MYLLTITCYILIFITKRKMKGANGVGMGLLLVTKGMISDFMECIIGSNMVLYINFNNILHYHMDALRSFMFGCSYFINPGYLVGQGWIRAMFLYPTDTVPEGSNVYQCFRLFLGVF